MHVACTCSILCSMHIIKIVCCLGLPSRICGQERPPGSYVSTSSQIMMAFHSDFYDVRDGFEITLTTFRERTYLDF